MLTKLSDTEKLTVSLRLPALPVDVVDAERALAEASDRFAAAGTVVSRLSSRLSPSMDGNDRRKLQGEIDRANAEANACLAEQSSAANRRDAAKKSFSGDVDQALAADIGEWERAVADRLSELAELLAIGARLDQEAKAARITVAAKSVLAAGHLAALLKPIAASFMAWRR